MERCLCRQLYLETPGEEIGPDCAKTPAEPLGAAGKADSLVMHAFERICGFKRFAFLYLEAFNSSL